MATCPTCAHLTAEGQSFCPSCGSPLGIDRLPTGTAPRPRTPGPAKEARSPTPRTAGTPRTPGAGSPVAVPSPGGAGPSAAASAPRFVPGALFGERYRIVGLLGRGGMGEVYRADDLRLGQAVALKFLPESFLDDAARRARFDGEVSIARQLAHPAVCRVYDVSDADGQPFLSMEYVDGEDLASLLRRIGRLPSDKAVDIARQLCAGLSAAHERGVLHRDLKPDNVMLDGRGKVRITDFGLAGLAESFAGDEVRSGTPAYMSPEQLAGREVTVASDVYALGLVLYELFTGRKAFEGRTLAELLRKHSETTPASPSTLVHEIDPAVERVILRCLEHDPRLRPASALAVAAALPGGDPLAAALAAGEIPSPEMVAAAGAVEGLRGRTAAVILALGLGAAALAAVVSPMGHLAGVVRLVKSPDALEDRAQDVLRLLGHAAARADSAEGFNFDADLIQHVESSSTSARRWQELADDRPPVLQYWYREGPRPLTTTSLSSRATWGSPPALGAGMAGVRLTMDGRLVGFYSVPPQVEEEAPASQPAAGASAPDWPAVLAQAGLDPARLTPDTPRWTPPLYADARAAWTGVDPERPDVRVRVEAASYRGRPVAFEVLGDWTRPDRAQPFQFSKGREAGYRILVVLCLALIGGALLLARQNVRLGRGDRLGAQRLAGFALALIAANWMLGAHHVTDMPAELGLMVRGLGVALIHAALIWVLYLALEPFVRRHWPDTLISWTRLLAGRWSDPIVGRDVLFGAAIGAGIAMSVATVRSVVTVALGIPPPAPIPEGLDTLLGVRLGLVTLADIAVAMLVEGMVVVLLRLALLRALRVEALAASVFILLLSLQDALVAGSSFWTMLVLTILVSGLPLYAVTRLGLLPSVVCFFTISTLFALPHAPSLGHWATHATVLSVLPAVALMVYGYQAARTRRLAVG